MGGQPCVTALYFAQAGARTPGVVRASNGGGIAPADRVCTVAAPVAGEHAAGGIHEKILSQVNF